MQNAKEDPVSWRAIIYAFFFSFEAGSCKGKDLASFSLIMKWCMRFSFVKICRKNEYSFHVCLQFLKWKNNVDFSVTGHAKHKTEGSLSTIQQ